MDFTELLKKDYVIYLGSFGFSFLMIFGLFYKRENETKKPDEPVNTKKVLTSAIIGSSIITGIVYGVKKYNENTDAIKENLKKGNTINYEFDEEQHKKEIINAINNTFTNKNGGSSKHAGLSKASNTMNNGSSIVPNSTGGAATNLSNTNENILLNSFDETVKKASSVKKNTLINMSSSSTSSKINLEQANF